MCISLWQVNTLSQELHSEFMEVTFQAAVRRMGDDVCESTLKKQLSTI